MGFRVMQRYPEYKESGIDSIGVIPKHWESSKLGYVSTIFKGGTPKRNVDRYFQGDLPWARPVNITGLKGALYINDTEIHISEEALGNSGARRLPVGTVLLTSRATIGETAITTVPMATNQGFANFYCNPELFNVFLVYYLQAIKDLLISLGSGSTFLEVTKRILLGVGIPVPPLPEQHAIANFLDRKTKQIDELIRVKERKIELLQEYRASLIHRAVTKGLDPNVEMKPSGVEWIGKMPCNWGVRKIKYTVSGLVGGVWGREPQVNENDIYCIRVTDFGYPLLAISTNNLTLRDIPSKERSKRILRTDDFLIEKSGGGEKTPVGRTVMFSGGIPRQCVTSNFISKFSVNSGSYYSRYLLYCLNSMYQLGLTRKHVKQSTGLQNLDIDSYFQEKIPVPRLVEQTQIANFLDHKTTQIDELRSTEEQTIKLLKEFRQSLISAVVTGKIDVRNEV